MCSLSLFYAEQGLELSFLYAYPLPQSQTRAVTLWSVTAGVALWPSKELNVWEYEHLFSAIKVSMCLCRGTEDPCLGQVWGWA